MSTIEINSAKAMEKLFHKFSHPPVLSVVMRQCKRKCRPHARRKLTRTQDAVASKSTVQRLADTREMLVKLQQSDCVKIPAETKP